MGEDGIVKWKVVAERRSGRARSFRDATRVFSMPPKRQSEDTCVYRRDYVSGAATAHVTKFRRRSWSSMRSCSRDAIVKNSY